VRIALDHVVIHVSDWERSNAFYRDVLGAELVRDPDGSLLELISHDS
jgi:catechol 2,3-dioxygenase-like lactoylglutathione lyase family enzyme